MKECAHCHRILDESQFNKHCINKDGLQSWCKECYAERWKNKDKIGGAN